MVWSRPLFLLSLLPLGLVSVGARADDCQFDRRNYAEAKAECARSGNCQYVEAMRQIVRDSCGEDPAPRPKASVPSEPLTRKAETPKRQPQKDDRDSKGIEHILRGCVFTVTHDGRNHAKNTCGMDVKIRYCGADAGIGESSGICGRNTNEFDLKQGQKKPLTQGRTGTTYSYFVCKAPYSPYQVSWNPSTRSLEASGCKR